MEPVICSRTAIYAEKKVFAGNKRGGLELCDAGLKRQNRLSCDPTGRGYSSKAVMDNPGSFFCAATNRNPDATRIKKGFP